MIDFIQFQQIFIEHLHWTTKFWLILPHRWSHSQNVLKGYRPITCSLSQIVNSPQQTNCWQCVWWPISTDSELISVVTNINIQHILSLTLHARYCVVTRVTHVPVLKGHGRTTQRSFWCLCWVTVLHRMLWSQSWHFTQSGSSGKYLESWKGRKTESVKIEGK